jgi:hypothetical protein
MGSFLRALFNGFFGRVHDRKISVFETLKGAIVAGLIPFVFSSLFIPLVLFQESLIFGLEYVFGDGVLLSMFNLFWSPHITICVGVIYSFKFTVYLNDLYTQARLFQFQTMVSLK